MLRNCGFLFPNNHSLAFFASPDRPPNGQKVGELDDGRISCDVHGGARTEPPRPAAKSVDFHAALCYNKQAVRKGGVNGATRGG